MAERPLPTGWWKTVDQSSGKAYFYKADGTRQWHFPGDPEPDEDGDNFAPIAASNPDNSRRGSVEGGGGGGGLSQAVVERSVVDLILSFLLFPFPSLLNTLIWGSVQVIFIILEIVAGFASLSVGGVGWLKGEEAYDDAEISFVVVFLIVDAFVWLGELIIHFALLKLGPADYLLGHPPTLDTPLTNFFPDDKPNERTLFYARVGFFVFFRIFQLVWTIIAFFKLSLEVLVDLDEDYEASFAHKTNFLRLIGLTSVVINFVSLTLWIFGFVCIYLLRAYGHEYLRPIPPTTVATNTDANINTNAVTNAGSSASAGTDVGAGTAEPAPASSSDASSAAPPS